MPPDATPDGVQGDIGCCRALRLTNHTHLVICFTADGDCHVRDLAARVGITERATQRPDADAA